MNTDLISRSDLMQRLERKKSSVHDKAYTDGFNDAILRVRSMVNGAAACPTTNWKAVLTDGLPPTRSENTISDRLMSLTLAIITRYLAGSVLLRNL